MKSVSINKLARFSAMCLACAIVVTNINPSFAQSIDRDNPTPLTVKLLSNPGEQNKNTVYYYSLTAKPGKITITLDSDSGNKGVFSTNIRIETLDGKRLEYVSAVSGSGSPQRSTKEIAFKSETPVLLLLSSSGHYRIKIEGNWTQLGSASTPPVQDIVVSTSTKPESKPANNLSGVYKCNDGGTYYVRQNGNSLWWYGESGDGVGWTNIFKGTIQGNDINGNWIDVPKGNNQGAGVMNLRVSNSKFISTYKTGGFSGSEWTRK
jgi:hypothetical protein